MKPLTSKEWRKLLKELKPEELKVLRQQVFDPSISVRDRLFWFCVGFLWICALGLIS